MSTISGHLTAFHGLPVFDHTATLSEESEAAELPAAADAAWKIGLDYDSELSFEEAWQAFLDSVDTTGVRAVVIGNWWGDDYDPLTRPLAAIVAAAGQLPALQALFIGDVVGEECELSWLQMTDITPVLESFAQLEELVVRGASAGYGPSDPPLSLRPLRHERLRALRFEAGGLPGSVVRSVTACEFPPWSGSNSGSASKSTAATRPSPTSHRCWPAPGYPRCAISAWRTASCRTRSPPPWPAHRWSPNSTG